MRGMVIILIIFMATRRNCILVNAGLYIVLLTDEKLHVRWVKVVPTAVALQTLP